MKYFQYQLLKIQHLKQHLIKMMISQSILLNHHLLIHDIYLLLVIVLYHLPNKLYQFYSPGVLFNRINNIESSKCRVVGGLINTTNSVKTRKENFQEAQFDPFVSYPGVISPFDVKSPSLASDYDGSRGEGLMARGIYGPGRIDDDSERRETYTYQFLRDYSGNFIQNTNNLIYKIKTRLKSM